MELANIIGTNKIRIGEEKKSHAHEHRETSPMCM